MKKLKKFFSLIFCCFLSTNCVYAQVGDFGFFGGISEGRKLPKTTEQILEQNKTTNSNLKTTYKEVLFLSGKPIEYEGVLATTIKGDTSEDFGTIKVGYKIQDSEATNEDVSINRNIQYNVAYRKENNQIIKDFEVSKWTEKIKVDGQIFTLDPVKSKSSISVIEDSNPAVNYYRGDISHKAVFVNSDKQTFTQDIVGTIYGYDSAWSSTETHRLDGTVTSNDWQLEYQVRPSVSVGKTLQYSTNEPETISFSGNYKEIMQNKSGLTYNIYSYPIQNSLNIKTYGNVSIDSFNNFEQLIAPKMDHLKGHFAESDIKKLFSMQILEGDTNLYKPNQVITRGEYVKMLIKAIKLPIKEKNTKTNVQDIVFADVLEQREEYPYIMAAYDTGIIAGRQNGIFDVDSPIERQEAIVMLIRTLGLENLGIETAKITPFVDDNFIDNWAKKEIYAANKIGIISGDLDGKFNPKNFVTKAEAAAIINRLNNYMRTDLKINYTENIINYSN